MLSCGGPLRRISDVDHIVGSVKVFEHLRLIVGMVLSLSVARLLNGVAKIVAHPKKIPIYSVHLGWVLAMLLFLIHFWWWEFKLSMVQQWTFEAYLLVVLYAVVFFLLCSLLFPDQMDDYTGFQDYFMSRRKWFFGILALSFILDIADTALKGMAYFNSLGLEYPIRSVVYIGLCVAAMFVSNPRFHLGFVTASLVYQLSFILRLYHTVQ